MADRADSVDGSGQGEVGRQGDRRQGARRVSNVEEKTFQDRQYIFRESELGEFAFVIQSGTVDITKHAGGGEVVLGTLGQGEMFGETALIGQCAAHGIGARLGRAGHGDGSSPIAVRKQTGNRRPVCSKTAQNSCRQRPLDKPESQVNCSAIRGIVVPARSLRPDSAPCS